MKVNIKTILISCIYLASVSLQATVKLPHVFSDNMVLQRDKPIKLWGWADKNETVEISFINQIKKVKADKYGNWSLFLDQVSFGGPYILKIKGKDNSISLRNILIGDVWFCSGQSNMEMPVHGWSSVYNDEEEIKNAGYPQIRAFNVARNMNTEPESDFNGTWTVCSSQTVASYSAVGYFFARKLNKELNIPIGIINSSWGGTEIESWISADAYRKLPEQIQDKYKNIKITNLDQFVKDNEVNKALYLEAINNDPGTVNKWFTPSTDIFSWNKMQIPQAWENVLGDIDGVVWFRYNFTLPGNEEGKAAAIQLGTIDDDDVVWINGVKVGETQGYATNRLYNIPRGILKAGQNVIVIKVSDHSGGGGIYGNPDNLYLKTADGKYSLSGEWSYKVAVTNAEFNYINISPNMRYALLYNAMINPVIQFPIKGAIWYQGESNVSQAFNYRILFPAMINDWRSKWGYQFPFYWVQLANYMSKDKVPQKSEWASLREAQTQTLSLPETGQIITTDIGDADDIHPRNKQDVGLRLALIALNKTYGMDSIICSGPTFKSMNIIGNKVNIEYHNVAQGLVVNNKYGYIEGFALAGPDQKFKWAQAYLDGDKVVVSSREISNPVAIRYSWSNNPDVNLFNSGGLPAEPFRTDDWEIHENK
ncbi:sialate O-acetylesterase [Dysgonomonas reticulitermitis]